MAFDIRNYNAPEQESSATANNDNQFWTQKYLKHVDDFFPKINSECEYLNDHKTASSEDAFGNKIEAWKAFVIATQRLCRLYKVKDAKCLSKKN